MERYKITFNDGKCLTWTDGLRRSRLNAYSNAKLFVCDYRNDDRPGTGHCQRSIHIWTTGKNVIATHASERTPFHCEYHLHRLLLAQQRLEDFSEGIWTTMMYRCHPHYGSNADDCLHCKDTKECWKRSTGISSLVQKDDYPRWKVCDYWNLLEIDATEWNGQEWRCTTPQSP